MYGLINDHFKVQLGDKRYDRFYNLKALWTRLVITQNIC